MFMYNHALHRGREYFCRYYLQTFSTGQILKGHVNDCSKINGKQMIKLPKKVNMVDSNVMKGK